MHSLVSIVALEEKWVSFERIKILDDKWKGVKCSDITLGTGSSIR